MAKISDQVRAARDVIDQIARGQTSVAAAVDMFEPMLPESIVTKLRSFGDDAAAALTWLIAITDAFDDQLQVEIALLDDRRAEYEAIETKAEATAKFWGDLGAMAMNIALALLGVGAPATLLGARIGSGWVANMIAAGRSASADPSTVNFSSAQVVASMRSKRPSGIAGAIVQRAVHEANRTHAVPTD